MGHHDHVLHLRKPTHSQQLKPFSTLTILQYGFSYLKGPKAFRIPWGLQMIPAIVLFSGMIFLPESPRWLGRKDRWDDARNVLALVHGKGNPNAPFVLTELKQIRDQIEFERNNANVTYLELFKPNMINRTHIGVFTQIWSQLTGMNVMMYCMSIKIFPPNTYSSNLQL